jgi:type IV secretion system protein VirB1
MIEMAMHCTELVNPETVMEVIRVESNGDPLALNINRLQKTQPKVSTVAEAAEMTRHYIEKGHSVDMGLMQVNSANLTWLGIPLNNVEVLFTPCANIQAGSRILFEAYGRAVKQFGTGQIALQAALSEYNTGNFKDGFRNGYVNHYIATKAKPTSYKETILDMDTRIVWNPPEGYYSNVITTLKKDQMMPDKLKANNADEQTQLDKLNPLDKKLSHMGKTPGLVIDIDPDEAEQMGAFEEHALSLEDALEASQ